MKIAPISKRCALDCNICNIHYNNNAGYSGNTNKNARHFHFTRATGRHYHIIGHSTQEWDRKKLSLKYLMIHIWVEGTGESEREKMDCMEQSLYGFNWMIFFYSLLLLLQHFRNKRKRKNRMRIEWTNKRMSPSNVKYILFLFLPLFAFKFCCCCLCMFYLAGTHLILPSSNGEFNVLPENSGWICSSDTTLGLKYM